MKTLEADLTTTGAAGLCGYARVTTRDGGFVAFVAEQMVAGAPFLYCELINRAGLLARTRLIAIAEVREIEPITEDRALATAPDLVCSLEDVAALIAESFGRTRTELIARDRTADRALARAAFCWLARKCTTASLAAIGAFIQRDHGSVSNGVRAIEDRMSYDLALAQHVRLLRIQLSHGTSNSAGTTAET